MKLNNAENLTLLFEAKRNKEQAEPMMKYMKGHFPFLGIKTPERKQLLNYFYKNNEILKEPFNEDYVGALWGKNEREYQYAALDYIGRSLIKLEKDHLLLLEKLIITKSWWDTIDGIAPNSVAKIAGEFPEVIPETIDGWAYSDDMWLNRTSILFQLKFKEKTNELLLYKYIKQNAESKDFFIQKAIGWALREYAKTNPASVKHFIENNTLAKLSVREGSKHLKKSTY
ncbi:DNA alkylation repair protein [Virgibacillus flavescens]|uniref:DNA alkylation repair protein n=1 Tax=Virgibacillus flavescens TaxID=1611422 RepID=UPI003D33D5CA